MGETTKIQWTDHTFNPWIGCARVAPGCVNCYAEADMDRRRGRVKWGPHGTRSVTSDAYWRQPVKWNKQAQAAGVRQRVFCASLADVFEDWRGAIEDHEGDYLYCDLDGSNRDGMIHHPDEALDELDPRRTRAVTMADLRADLFKLIDATPWLDWLLLTKRPQNVVKMWPVKHDQQPIFPGMPGPLGQPQPCIVQMAHRPNVWLGTSISEQATADINIPALLTCRHLAPVLFLSAEPLLGPVDLRPWIWSQNRTANLDWIIVGGESGPQARPCEAKWIRDLHWQCRDAGVACFVKQLGTAPRPSYLPSDLCIRGIKDKKGGNPAEWPEELRIRQFPEVTRA